jgi:MYXO-CTERM domain-containing protein
MTRSLTAWAAGALLALAGTAHATSYEYHFAANPSADSEYPIDPNLDVQYTFGFNDSLPSYDLSTLNTASYWTSGAIWLKATFQGQTVNLADALDPTATGLQLPAEPLDDGSPDAYPSGFIEAYGSPDEFLDVDLHPWSSFVAKNKLPFDPFVYSQLDIYNDQQDFKDAYAVWAQGDLSSLASHVSSVPEGSSAGYMLLGLGALGLTWRRRTQA